MRVLGVSLATGRGVRVHGQPGRHRLLQEQEEIGKEKVRRGQKDPERSRERQKDSERCRKRVKESQRERVSERQETIRGNYKRSTGYQRESHGLSQERARIKDTPFT